MPTSATSTSAQPQHATPMGSAPLQARQRGQDTTRRLAATTICSSRTGATTAPGPARSTYKLNTLLFVGRPLLAAPRFPSLEGANSRRIRQVVACNGKTKYGRIASLQML